MAWDANRPVPWTRLMRDWVVYVGIMAAVFVVVYRDELEPGPFIGLLLSGPVFLVIGAVLAKFGYQRKTFRDLRADTAARQAAARSERETTAVGAGRSRPAPTRRTSTGPNRGRPSSRSRRR